MRSTKGGPLPLTQGDRGEAPERDADRARTARGDRRSAPRWCRRAGCSFRSRGSRTARCTGWRARPPRAEERCWCCGVPFSEPVDVTPPGFNVRTTVHEYGGGAYLIHDGAVFFSHFADQRLYRQELGGEPMPITADTGGRGPVRGRTGHAGRAMADLCPRASSGSRRSLRRDERVGRDPAGRVVRSRSTIRSGRDFYSTPRISPDGSDALLAGVGSAVDAVGRVRGLRRRSSREDASLGNVRAGRRPGRRGVDLPARVEPGRRPPLRLGSDRLVEPLSGARR